ncbi:MAG: L-glutamate gamma-semialdehyde dehydrogenase [Acidobacteriota bacterium]
MRNGIAAVPMAANEPIRQYRPGSPERESLKKTLSELKSTTFEIPLIIGGREIKTGRMGECRMPHAHGHVLATYHQAGPEEVALAVEESQKAWQSWSAMPWEDRVAIFRRMAVLLAGPYRDLLNASSMLGQSKTVFQAEIDSACELIDFFNFNCSYLAQIYADQPPYSSTGTWNQLEYRPLEGFVFAVTPFNFTSIAGNLPTSPALMGNVVLWKPASSAVYSAYFLARLFREAGIPDGVINFIPGPGSRVGAPALDDPRLAGIHFTGSTEVFQQMWTKVGANIRQYRVYPRIVGETGGKDYIFVHESAGVDETVTALVRGAFEYQGQKCSAASRAYIPDTLWPQIREKYVAAVESIAMGDIEDFSNFMGAVIDRGAFKSITAYIDFAAQSADAEIITGGHYDDATGYFIEPTTIVTTNPDFRTMVEEIFGPVLTIFVYQASQYEAALRVCDATSPYALTGSIFARDRAAVIRAREILTHNAGNFYINDKPTGAVVGQQPFGGARASGTNDKAGSALNLLRWASVRTIKENYLPPTDYRYPHMGGQ